MKKILLLIVLTGLCGIVFSQVNPIQTMIDNAVKNGASSVTIPAGTYNAPVMNNGAHLVLQNLNNFTVNATGVIMICGQRGPSLWVNHCTNVTVNGLTVDHNPLPYSQGTIIGHASDWSWTDIQIHAGYPYENITDSKVEIYDPQTRLLKKDIWTIYGAPVAKQGTNVYRISNTQQFSNGGKNGDLVTVDMPIDAAHGVKVEFSKNTLLDHVTIWSAPVFGLLEYQSESSFYNYVKIEPGPIPSGATQPRLKSATADGIHSVASRVGPRIENCVVQDNSDDGIAIHGNFHYALKTSGNILYVAVKSSNDMYVGDTIQSIFKNCTPNTTAKVVAVSGVTSAEAATLKTIRDSIAAYDNNISSSQFDNYFKITLNKSIAIERGSAVYSINQQGNGFIVKNNYIHNKRARGILIKASRGIIDGNTLDWIQMAGIDITPELWWMESGLSDKIYIRNNILKKVFFGPEVSGSQSGAICVVTDYVSAKDAQTNIEISGNKLDSCNGVNVLVTSSAYVTVKDNQVTNFNYLKHANGADIGLDDKTVFWFQNTDHVTVQNNKVYCTGTEQLVNKINVTDYKYCDGIQCMSSSPAQIGTGDGLNAEYFNGQNFNTSALTRVDPVIDFNWGGGSPGAGVNNDSFSARWTGYIQPLYSGVDTILINSDNGRRVWINNQLVIDKWINDWGIWYSGTVNLTAGQFYPIKIEYFEDNGGAGIQLQWANAKIKRQDIPQSQLYTSICNPVSTTIAEETNKEEMNIYPNPLTEGEFTLVLSGFADKECELNILDVQGKIILQKKIETDLIAHVNTSSLNLNKGMYFVSVKNKNSFNVKKLIIQ